MSNSAVKRQLFTNKKDAVQPVTLSNVNLLPNGSAFFNPNADSRIMDAPYITFEANNQDHMKLITLGNKKSGRFTITGYVKWTDEVKQVETRGTPDPPGASSSTFGPMRRVRDGVIADDSHSFPFSAWEN